ncbi:hypothetical protein CDQ84_00705 [Clostridium thermosuccinogenes]|uniref:Uncharacterized protein n=2 Tax=Clostridium thermosuccinogenes TaxID=84032 RepID=A0A2K2FN80_9CLOT|nr:hypothetical protein CDO33_16695 [Pseudoclostridium thermosuccinogenes]PNU00237.1 hypothetical protein CDQ85_00705 [Pseudoclostridium thermosuccinogenes]PNU01561.1 hypothetical protein CDQ84_00705 [Pseudoclostridium thermosuccinogenes]
MTAADRRFNLKKEFLNLVSSYVNAAYLIMNVNIKHGGFIMQSYEPQFSIPIIDTEQALADIMESIAMKDTALSRILNAEGEMLQKATRISGNTDAFINVNESVNSVMRNVTRLQMLLQFELENVEALLRAVEDMDELEE